MRKNAVPWSIEEITDLLVAWRVGDRAAREALVRALYPRLESLAANALRSDWGEGVRLEVGELVHEAYLKLVSGELPQWRDRGHFLGIVARLMRQILVDRARLSAAEKRGGGSVRLVGLDGFQLTAEWEEEPELLDVNRALDELCEIDESAARVVELRFFAGLSIEETAESLGLGLSTVKRRWRFARAWLRESMAGGRSSPPIAISVAPRSAGRAS